MANKRLFKLAYNGRNPSTHYVLAETYLQAITDTIQYDEDGTEKSINEVKITEICSHSEIVNYDKDL